MADSDTDIAGQYNGGALVATATLFLILTWLSVVLRSLTRALLIKSFQIDDWLMLIAQIIFTASCSFILAGVGVGLGHHNAAIGDTEDKVQALMWQALATATYVLDMMFIKLSIGIFLLRLSVENVYRRILWTSLTIIAIWSSVIFIWDVFQCSPIAKQWDFRITSGHCVSAQQVVSAAYAISVMTIVSDWLYALLPIFMLWKVKMTMQAKVTVIMILGLGIFASIATLIRLRFLADLGDTTDILYAGTDAMVWTLVEPGVAIVASSLATIRPLLRAMRIRGFEPTNQVSGSRRSGNTARSTPRRGLVEAMSDSNKNYHTLHDVSMLYPDPEADDDEINSINMTLSPLSPNNKTLPAIPEAAHQRKSPREESSIYGAGPTFLMRMDDGLEEST